MTAFVVFNPNSGGGRTGRDWHEIEEALEQIFPADVLLRHHRRAARRRYGA